MFPVKNVITSCDDVIRSKVCQLGGNILAYNYLQRTSPDAVPGCRQTGRRPPPRHKCPGKRLCLFVALCALCALCGVSRGVPAMRFCLFVDSVILANWSAAGLPREAASAKHGPPPPFLTQPRAMLRAGDKPLAVAVWDVLIFRAWTSRK